MQWVGLQSVSRCAQSGVVLHGTSTENQGIAECHLLVKEFDKCQAGGLPPPSRIPTEQEARQQAEEDKKQAEAKKQIEEEAKKRAEELERLGQETAHASSLIDETDLLMLTSPAPPLSEAGVSAAHSQNPQAEAARNRLLAIQAKCDAILNRVTFCDTFDELLAKSKERLQNTSRSFILVEAPTTHIGYFSQLLDLAKQACDAYLSGTGSGAEQVKFRIVVLVGRRYDLLAKISDRGSVLWPKWSLMVVQLRKRDTQSHKLRPSYAVVLAQPADLAAEPTGITLPKCGGSVTADQGVNMRCTEAKCPYRQTALDAAAAKMSARTMRFRLRTESTFRIP